MSPENTGSNKNQKPKLTKKIILLVPVILAIASATLYRESNSTSPSSTTSGLDGPARAQTRVHDYLAAERQFMLERFDHSVVNQHSTSHNSDLPGASIAAY